MGEQCRPHFNGGDTLAGEFCFIAKLMIYITLGNLQWNVDKAFSFVVINTIVISGFHSAVLPHKHAISQHITTHPDDQNNTNNLGSAMFYLYGRFHSPLYAHLLQQQWEIKMAFFDKKPSKSRESVWILKCRMNITEFFLLPDSKVFPYHVCSQDWVIFTILKYS